jgi:hypothetical protein
MICFEPYRIIFMTCVVMTVAMVMLLRDLELDDIIFMTVCFFMKMYSLVQQFSGGEDTTDSFI